MNGHWVKSPGQALFNRLKEIFGDLPFVAEDLGLITPEVDELREYFGMPGMRILQFGFAERGGHTYLPHRYIANTVVYTGTHDNNTTLGWWREDTTLDERTNVQIYLGPVDPANDHEIVWDMIRAAADSVANISIYPLQDVLELGSEARMNRPGANSGNWTWRVGLDDLKPEFSARLCAITEMSDRDGYHKPIEGESAGSPTDSAALRILEGATR